MIKYLLFIFTLTFCWTNEQIFVACEGNYYENDGSLWTISEETVYGYPDNPIGNVVQSLYVHGNKLFIIINGSSNIQVFDIDEESLTHIHSINTNGSGPREMLIYGNFIYLTNWYSSDIKKINLNTWEIELEIQTPGLPEDIVMHNDLLYVSITMNHDWTDGNQIITIDPNIDTIIESFEVGLGPGALLVHEGEIYVARTYYDDDWNAFYGTSKINSDGAILVANYGPGTGSCGGGVYSYKNEVYRLYDGGIAKIDDSLQIMPETRIGNFDSWEVYSAEVIGEYIYFGLSDYAAPDEVVVVNVQGDEVNRFQVGAVPGDFASYCISDGNINSDTSLNILDIVQISENIITGAGYNCLADINVDNLVNILDIIILVEIILN